MISKWLSGSRKLNHTYWSGKKSADFVDLNVGYTLDVSTHVAGIYASGDPHSSDSTWTTVFNRFKNKRYIFVKVSVVSNDIPVDVIIGDINLSFTALKSGETASQRYSYYWYSETEPATSDTRKAYQYLDADMESIIYASAYGAIKGLKISASTTPEVVFCIDKSLFFDDFSQYTFSGFQAYIITLLSAVCTSDDIGKTLQLKFTMFGSDTDAYTTNGRFYKLTQEA